MKPPFAYYGGKGRLADWIVSLLPPHRVYVEPFAGSLAVLLSKQPAEHEIINDLDGDVVNFWQQLRNRPDVLARACWATPYARDEYAQARKRDATDDLERARQWWVVVTQSFGQMNTGATGWSYSTNRSNSGARTENAVARMESVAARMRNVIIENRDALDTIRSYDGPDTVHYVDPPYPSEARNSTGYRFEMGDADRHRELAEVLHGCEGTVVLSGYRCPLYDDLFGDWQRHETKAVKSNGGGVDGRGDATEAIWSNRPLGRQMDLWTTEPASA